MKLYKLEIENFRGVRNGMVIFGQHPVFIGANNTGKTTVIEALALLLGRDKLVKELSEHDFYGSNPQPHDRIKLIVTITDFLENDPDYNTHWFRDGRAVPKWLNKEDGNIYSAQQNDSWLLCCQIAGQAHFDHESMSVEFIRYFHDHDEPIDPFDEDVPTPVPGILIRELGFFLTRANRSWDKMLTWGSELFRRTLSTTASQPFEAILAERNRLRNPTQAIDEDPNISPLIKNVNSEISLCIPSSPKLKLRLTATDCKSVMDGVEAHFSIDSGICVPSGRQGSGLISLQGLFLLLELGRVRAEAGEEFIMALEEPELHLSPSAQHQIIHRLQSLSSQTLVTTHSPSVASIADPTCIMILHNQDGELSSQPLLKNALDVNSPSWKRKFFQQHRKDVIAALMQPFVLVPEGKTEFYLLDILLRPLLVTDGWICSMSKPFNLHVGVLPTEDAKVVETHEILRDVHQHICCLVDGDVDGKRYAASLLSSTEIPHSIMRWKDGETIEDVIGWIISASENEAVSSLSVASQEPLQSVADVVKRLKARKIDIVFYEFLADFVANSGDCRVRAASFFSSLAQACANEESTNFEKDLDGIWTFKK